MKMFCQELLEVNYANLEEVHTSIMNSLVVLIIIKCYEVNNTNLKDVHNSLVNSLVVLIIITML